MNISNFKSEDKSALQQVFSQQLKSHFNLLTHSIPSLKEIQWTSSQEDEDLYTMTEFHLTKDNGYKYERSDDDYGRISGTEFTEEEYFLLNEFIDYLDYSSEELVVIFGDFTFSLTAK